MPMNRKLYPANWDEIARSVKDEATWHCEACGKPCRKPGEKHWQLLARLPDIWIDDLELSDEDDARSPRWTRFVLTVAHLDHRPENCDRSNLRALCAPCHCRYDLAAMAQKKRLKAERNGQLNLLEVQTNR